MFALFMSDTVAESLESMQLQAAGDLVGISS